MRTIAGKYPRLDCSVYGHLRPVAQILLVGNAWSAEKGIQYLRYENIAPRAP
jgi:hypothetical protein